MRYYNNLLTNKNSYYPYDNRIHNFGNTGLGGKIHAELAPIVTNAIDKKAYNGINIRKMVYNDIPDEYSVLDLCCGVGLSTRVTDDFDRPNYTVGIDTSPQMINKARRLNSKIKNDHRHLRKFFLGNSENYGKLQNLRFDVVTCMFAFHEMPEYAHHRIINNALNIAKKEVIILDIAPNYKSNMIMRSGEPFLETYKKSIQKTMEFYDFNEQVLFENHAHKWILKI